MTDLDFSEQVYCVVGAGPAGLATSRALARLGVPHVVYEKHSDVGGIWDMENPGTPMYESAHFISSKWTSGFAGFPMTDIVGDYPHHPEVLQYLRAFADAYGLRRHIRLGAEVRRIEQEGAAWRVRLADGSAHLHRGVICANGTTWLPSLPEWPGPFNGELRHSVSYRSPEEFRGRRVLVVGLGNSGADIACDAARCARHAAISIRRGYHFLPKHVYGWPTDVFVHRPDLLPEQVRGLDLRAGVFAVTGDVRRWGLPAPDHAPGQSHPLMNTQLLHHFAHGDIEVRPDLECLEGDRVRFKDGSRMEVDLLLAATGYRVEVPYMDRRFFEHRGGRVIHYLNVFNRNYHELFTMGFAEVASGIYPLLDQMAHLLACHLRDRLQEPFACLEFEQWKMDDDFDVRGDRSFIDSARHANYVDLSSYVGHVDRLCRHFGWPSFDSLDHTPAC
jgi:cation diffusion facilitator CzcD-associated flavoprotein CzcO